MPLTPACRVKQLREEPVEGKVAAAAALQIDAASQARKPDSAADIDMAT